MALLTQVTVTSSYVSGVLPALLVLGLGLGLIFAQAINTATAGVAPRGLRRGLRSGQHDAAGRRVDRDVGAQHDRAECHGHLPDRARHQPPAPAIAATYGYTIAFGVSAGLLGVGFILAIVLLPSRRRLGDLRERGRRNPACTQSATRARLRQLASEAIPVALCSCPPLITRAAKSSDGPGTYPPATRSVQDLG